MHAVIHSVSIVEIKNYRNLYYGLQYEQRWTNCYNINDLGLYSGSVRFESRPGSQLSFAKAISGSTEPAGYGLGSIFVYVITFSSFIITCSLFAFL
jgi:hypothetical protein